MLFIYGVGVMWGHLLFLILDEKREIEIKSKVIWLIIYKETTGQIEPWGIKVLCVDATVIWPSYNKCTSHVYAALVHSKGHLISFTTSFYSMMRFAGDWPTFLPEKSQSSSYFLATVTSTFPRKSVSGLQQIKKKNVGLMTYVWRTINKCSMLLYSRVC